jgi:hypothetical protein
MAISGNNSNTATAEELMPDPTQPRGGAAQGDADDLIASIADQQIDALISESGELQSDKPTSSAVAAELAVQATQELQEMAQQLSDEARADLVADLNGAATEAMLKPIPEAGEPPAKVPSAAIEAMPAASAPIAEPIAPVIETALAPEPTMAAPQPPSPPDVLPAVGPAMVIAPTDAEINQAEIDALISQELPKASEAQSASVETPAPPARSESSAEAVARELAEDVKPDTSHSSPVIVEPLSLRIRDAVTGVVMTVLNVINLPVRNLSDNAREVIGIVGIVTLVNAMSLLLYLMLFR